MIPRLIHQVWVGGPMPARLDPYRRSWLALHPAWRVITWTERELRGWLRNQTLFDRAEEITPHVGQFRADVARYEILERHGGVYVDCDMEALRSIDGLLDVPAFAAWETDGQWINNAVLGCVPGHPMMGELVERLPGWVDEHKGPNVRPNVLSGPQFLTPLARGRDDITLHPAETFYPYRWDELHRQGEHFAGAYAVHHWDNMRKRKGLV